MAQKSWWSRIIELHLKTKKVGIRKYPFEIVKAFVIILLKFRHFILVKISDFLSSISWLLISFLIKTSQIWMSSCSSSFTVICFSSGFDSNKSFILSHLSQVHFCFFHIIIHTFPHQLFLRRYLSSSFCGVSFNLSCACELCNLFYAFPHLRVESLFVRTDRDCHV